jgi:hypothetical protein
MQTASKQTRCKSVSTGAAPSAHQFPNCQVLSGHPVAQIWWASPQASATRQNLGFAYFQRSLSAGCRPTTNSTSKDVKKSTGNPSHPQDDTGFLLAAEHTDPSLSWRNMRSEGISDKRRLARKMHPSSHEQAVRRIGHSNKNGSLSIPPRRFAKRCTLWPPWPPSVGGLHTRRRYCSIYRLWRS